MEDVIASPLPGERRTDSDERQERAWIEASRKGDPAAFNRLVLKWERRVYNLVLRMLGNREDAAETTQEIFLAVFRAIGRFQHQARFSTWLYRVAVNHCLTRLRRRPPLIQSMDEQDEHAVPFGERLGTADHQDRDLLRLERRRIVRQSLAGLSDEQRVVVELKFFQEETFLSISEILRVPESTVKSRFYAALEVLKGRLGALE